MSVQVLVGDCRERLAELDAGSVQTCITSPPYLGLRDYGCDGQIGLEETPAAYVAALVEVFAEVWRVLADDGTLWLNLGDSYANDAKWGGATGGKHAAGLHGEPVGRLRRFTGLKPKDLIGIPWRVAFALQDAGWTLRSDIVWSKPNAMPESVQDRPTRSHEYIFLLARGERYFYDAEAIKEPVSVASDFGKPRPLKAMPSSFGHHRSRLGAGSVGSPHGRNKRDVWSVPVRPYVDAHFATYPPQLIEPCILAGSRPGDVVLDPFGGSGTTAEVAIKHRRRAVLCELNPAYAALIDKRLNGVQVTLPFEEVTA